MHNKDRLFHERKAQASGFVQVAGVDEAGRGPLAGPLVVAACILSPHLSDFSYIRDSKQMTALQRQRAYDALLAGDLVAYAIITISVEIIDTINIFQATMQGMQQAVKALPICPDCVLVDGNKTPALSMPSVPIVGGDRFSVTIAAASILAKVTRDRLMLEAEELFPGYGFALHKGYPTSQHRQALQQKGVTPFHRKSYAPVKKLLSP